MKIKKSFVFFSFLMLVILLITSIHYKKIEGSLIEICQSNAHSIALKCTEDAINENIQDITYSSIINLEKNSEGKIVAITSNVNELNRLSNKLITSVEENLQKNQTSKIEIPIGTLLGSKALGGYGMKVKVKTFPIGDTNIEYMSYFDNVGINQTRHRIIVKVSSQVKVIAPFYTALDEYSKEVVLAETVLIGEIPSSYYNISGVENLESRDILTVGE
ncbi:MAG: sporulation protein YunB [Clostridia bacterium]|nr:sporulation protein YunB [Clostridia bacterium]